MWDKFSISFAFSLLSVPITIYIARILKFYDKPGKLKIHVKNIPYSGSIFFISLLYLFKTEKDFVVFAILIVFIGILDDFFKLSARLRFIVESLVFTILWFDFQGAHSFFNLRFWFLFYLFFMGTINSVNWMDGMDGLLAGISIIVSSGFLWLAHSLGHPWLPQFALAFIGALLGFLIFNFHPARIFLGDAGSYFIGFNFFYMSVELLKFAFSWKLFFSILGLLSVFIVDSTIAVIRRIRNGLHPFRGDRSHIYDQIYRRTGNYLGTVFLMYLLAGLGVVVGLITYSLPDRYWLVFWVSSAIVAYTILFKFKFVSITIVSDKLETHGEKS